MLTPILETERLILRPLKVADAEAVFNNWAGDPDTTKYMCFTTHESIETTVEWLKTEEENLTSDTMYNWGFSLKETGGLIGSGGISFNDKYNMFELGYIIMKEHWGKGLTTEAAKAVIDFAVKELKQSSFYAQCAKENIGSWKVMEKIGFVYHGDSEYTSIDGKRTFEGREYFLHIVI